MMKNEYKEVFDAIVPDCELVNSVTEMKLKNKTSMKPFVAVLCIFTAVIGVCSAVFIKNQKGTATIVDTVTLLVAYETGKRSESLQHITKVLSGGKEIIIDADVVIDGNADDMCIYSAENMLFYEEELNRAIFENEKLYWGEEERAYIGYPIGSGITFNVSETEELKSFASKGEGYARGCEISYRQAKEISDKFLSKTGRSDFHFVEGNIADSEIYGRGYSSTGAGFYTFRYSQFADGFPLETVTSNVYSGVASLLDVFINDEGITYLRMCGLDLTKKKELNGNIISVENAIDMIEKNLSDLWLSEYAPIVEIRLEYMLDQSENGELEVVPCWHFCVDQTKIKFLSTEEQRKNDTNDLCVNAVTGEMFRVADRYPVYKTEDRIISTWKK